MREEVSDMTDRIVWRKSSFSGGGDASGGNCVEVACPQPGRLSIRDSKHPVTTGELQVNPQFISWVKDR
jgi:hypothetical protein